MQSIYIRLRIKEKKTSVIYYHDSILIFNPCELFSRLYNSISIFYLTNYRISLTLWKWSFFKFEAIFWLVSMLEVDLYFKKYNMRKRIPLSNSFIVKIFYFLSFIIYSISSFECVNLHSFNRVPLLIYFFLLELRHLA